MSIIRNIVRSIVGDRKILPSSGPVTIPLFPYCGVSLFGAVVLAYNLTPLTPFDDSPGDLFGPVSTELTIAPSAYDGSVEALFGPTTITKDVDLTSLVAENGFGFYGFAAVSGSLQRHNIDSKTIVWENTAEMPANSVQRVDATRDFVWVSFSNDEVRKFNAVTGAHIWTHTSFTNWVTAVAADPEGNVYAGGLEAKLKKLDPDGNIIWTIDITPRSVDRIEVVGDGIIVGSSSLTDVRIEKYRFDGSSSPIWTNTFPTNTKLVLDIYVDQSGNIYASTGLDNQSAGGYLRKMTSAGVTTWTTDQYDGDPDQDAALRCITVDETTGDVFVEIDGLTSRWAKYNSSGVRQWKEGSFIGQAKEGRHMSFQHDGYIWKLTGAFYEWQFWDSSDGSNPMYDGGAGNAGYNIGNGGEGWLRRSNVWIDQEDTVSGLTPFVNTSSFGPVAIEQPFAVAPLLLDTVSQDFGTAATAHVVTMPASPAAGDLLVAQFISEDGETINTPAGWTSLHDSEDTLFPAEVGTTWSATRGGAGGGSFTLGPSAAGKVDDYHLIVVALANTEDTPSSPTTPSGWTQQDNWSSGFFRYIVYHKIATSAAAQSPSINIDEDGAAVHARFQHWDENLGALNYDHVGNTNDPPSRTVAAGNNLFVTTIGSDEPNGSACVAPSGYTLLAEAHRISVEYAKAGIAVKETTAGTENPGAWSVPGTGGDERTGTIPLLPAANPQLKIQTFYKSAAGTETTVDFTSTAATRASVHVRRYAVGTWGGTPEAASSVSEVEVEPNPPSLNPTGWGTEKTAWLVQSMCLDGTLESTPDSSLGVDTTETSVTGGTYTLRLITDSVTEEVASKDPAIFAAFTAGNEPAASLTTTIAIKGALISAQDYIDQLSILADIHVDASDITTLWQDSTRTTQVASDGDTIEAVDDISGNARHAINSIGTLVYKSAGLNGKPTVRASGATNDSLTTTASWAHGTPATLFYVMRNDDSAGTKYMSAQGAGGAIRIFFASDAGTGTGPGFYDGAHKAFGTANENDEDVFSVRFNIEGAAGAAGDAALYQGGTPVQVGSDTAFTTFNQTEEHRLFGSSPPPDADLSEYMLIPKVIDKLNHDDAMQAFASKWGL